MGDRFWEQRLVLLRPPSSNNAYFTTKFGKRALSTEGRRFKEACQLIARTERVFHHEGAVDVFVMAYPPDRRKRDLMNLEKLMSDAFTGILYRDDSLIEDFRIRKGPLHNGGGAVRYLIRDHIEEFDIEY